MSSGLEKGFEPDAQISAALEAFQQQELIDEDRSQGPATRCLPSSGGHRTVQAEDRFELLVKVLDRDGAQLVQQATDLDALIGVRIAATLGHDEAAVPLLTELLQIRIAILLVAQQKVHLGGHLPP